jgi:hypothetical protein
MHNATYFQSKLPSCSRRKELSVYTWRLPLKAKIRAAHVLHANYQRNRMWLTDLKNGYIINEPIKWAGFPQVTHFWARHYEFA